MRFEVLYEKQMVDIIAAIPESHRNVLTPYLKVKPVRTASGVAVVVFVFQSVHPRLSCVNRTVVRMSPTQEASACIVPAVPTPTLSTPLNHTPDTSQRGFHSIHS